MNSSGEDKIINMQPEGHTFSYMDKLQEIAKELMEEMILAGTDSISCYIGMKDGGYSISVTIAKDK